MIATYDETYTTREASRRSGATFRQLDYWERTGVLAAAIPAQGSGSRRRWSKENIQAATALAALTSAVGGIHLHDLLCRVARDTAGATFPVEIPLGKGLTLVYDPIPDEEER